MHEDIQISGGRVNFFLPSVFVVAIDIIINFQEKKLARQYDVSLRRIQQLVKEYKQTGKLPCLDLKRRPRGKPLTNVKKEIIVLIFLHNSFKTQYIVLKFQKITMFQYLPCHIYPRSCGTKLIIHVFINILYGFYFYNYLLFKMFLWCLWSKDVLQKEK